jgi:hypothetical protein
VNRYLLCPGTVRSITDGQSHYISSDALARLYNVSPAECVIRPGLRPYGYPLLGWGDGPGLIELHPQRSGWYELPDERRA